MFRCPAGPGLPYLVGGMQAEDLCPQLAVTVITLALYKIPAIALPPVVVSLAVLPLYTLPTYLSSGCTILYNVGMFTTETAKAIRAAQMAPGRCEAIDVDGRRCRYTWVASPPTRRYCLRCRSRLTMQRHRQRKRNNNVPYY